MAYTLLHIPADGEAPEIFLDVSDETYLVLKQWQHDEPDRDESEGDWITITYDQLAQLADWVKKEGL